MITSSRPMSIMRECYQGVPLVLRHLKIDHLQEDNWPNPSSTVLPVIVNNECYCYSTELRTLSIETRNPKQAEPDACLHSTRVNSEKDQWLPRYLTVAAQFKVVEYQSLAPPGCLSDSY